MAQAAKEAFKFCQGSVIIEAFLYHASKLIFIAWLDDATKFEFYVNDFGSNISEIHLTLDISKLFAEI